MPARSTKTLLTALYRRLFTAFGPQHWWPAQTKFEVIVGAILTQNTNWGNVEKALANLKQKRKLTPQALNAISHRELASLIKPAGYFNIKAVRLKNFMSFFFKEYQGRLGLMRREKIQTLRPKLLNVKGIGPETADSILLYALDKPVFVVDAYTKRVLYRHNFVGGRDDYHAIQGIFMDSLNRKTRVFNEYHALIVRLGKEYCKPNPNCRECILNTFRYSLTNKCGRCHRALPNPKERRFHKHGFLCKECGVK